jgi:hypothetical protein
MTEATAPITEFGIVLAKFLSRRRLLSKRHKRLNIYRHLWMLKIFFHKNLSGMRSLVETQHEAGKKRQGSSTDYKFGSSVSMGYLGRAAVLVARN